MDYVSKIVTGAISIAVGLALSGKLPSATREMMLKAAEAQQHGLVSLSALNHALVDGPSQSNHR